MQSGRQADRGQPGADLDLAARGAALLRRLAPYLVTVAAACLLLAGAGPARAQHPNVARGFSPSGMFDVGGLDVVNGFNGNLVITIPIGQKYPVGGLMGSYSFSLVYNSNVWSHAIIGEGGGIDATDAIADPVANAGLGWRFSLGRIGTDFGIGGFEEPINGEDNAYYAPDGSEHYLYGAPADPAWFTIDGSHLRFLTGAQEVDFPDGMRHSFNGDGYPLSILDQLGNGLLISYVRFPAPNQDLYSEWDIQDTSGAPGRIHHVYFRLTGYSGNEQRAVVDHIDLATFGGGVATYSFLYNDETAPGVGTQTVRMTGAGTMDPAGWNPRVFLLTRLLLPADASSYRASYRMPIASYQAQQSSPVDHPGPINSMIFPTAGSAAWSYAIQPLPQPSSKKAPLNTIWSNALAVATRSLFDAGGSRIGDWSYSGTPVTGAPGNEVTRQLVYPPADPSSGTPGHSVVTYYSTCVHATCPGSGVPDTYAVDYGLPFSRLRAGDGAGRFLSQQIFEPGAANPVRSIYVAYENDGTNLDSDEPIYANQRQQTQRTFYLDDPLGSASSAACHGQPSACSSVTVDSSDYDGFGHYRQQTTSDTFGIGTPHIERTEWNQFLPGPPASGQPWILNTYTAKQQQEGIAVQRQEAFFETGTGFLQCSRRLKSGTTRSVHDVVVAADRDASGNVLAEREYGGDTGMVSTAGTCPAGNDVPAYTSNHTYASGVRSTTTVQLAAGRTLSLLNLAIDPGSGLPSLSTDPSGVPTSFTYDAMGRLLSTSPRGDATTTVTYQLGDQAPPHVTRTVGPGLEQETWQLDGLGRTVQHAVTLPGTVPPATTATSYDALGWKLLVTEPSSGKGTSFQGYDAFGRPGRVTTADGKYTTYGYRGARTVSRTSYVQQQTQQTNASGNLVWVTGELPAMTVETYDGRGRLLEVLDPNGTRTHYHYDIGGRLEAVATAVTAGSQVRSFQVDGRGFLVREVSPEGGAVSYRYDARGNVTQRTDAAGAVFSTYDAAGRLLAVDSTASGSSMHLRKLEYDTAANGTGKLATAHAYNWRSADSCAVPYEVRQDMAYDPSHGRLASETTTLLHGSSLESWTQSYVYDGAGRITTTTYPTCLALCTAPARSATTAYSYGRPVSVSGFASSITYNPNGTLATINHVNGVTFTQQPDPTGMPRPASLGVTAPANLWPTEAYSYDGSGNVTQIGAKSFTYDPDSRLVSATEPLASPNPYQQLTYDAFGNITQVASGTAPGNTPTSVSYDTIAATNHLSAASYDPSGTLHNYQLSTYLWDRFQQLTDLMAPAESWVHVYDAMGERVWSWRTSPSRLDTYALRGQGGHVLSLFTKTGSTYTWEDYVYREGQLLGAQASSGAVTHYDVDHLGSLRLESDQGGQVFTPHEYWPFGEEITVTTSSAERMRFTGHERDLADDVDYMHARYYKGLFGRFLSPDPHRGSLRIPQSLNRYAYVVGNPMKYVDPTGEVFVLNDCGSGGNAQQCNQQKSLLQQALGDTYSFVQVNKDGTVTLKVSASAFASHGTFEKGLGDLIGAKARFTLFTGRGSGGGNGGLTVPLPGGGANIYIDANRSRFQMGDIANGTAAQVFVHEIGHAVGDLFPKYRDKIDPSLSNSYLTKADREGYAVTFENRYRAEHHLELRGYYLVPSDVLFDSDVSLFPP